MLAYERYKNFRKKFPFPVKEEPKIQIKQRKKRIILIIEEEEIVYEIVKKPKDVIKFNEFNADSELK